MKNMCKCGWGLDRTGDEFIDCQRCGERYMDKEMVVSHKQVIEKDCAAFAQPRATIFRALHYAIDIYRVAAKTDRKQEGERFKTQKDDECITDFTRRFGDARDPTTGGALILAKGANSLGKWTQILVVFRGSSGDKKGAKSWFGLGRETNPQGSGWDEKGETNVDWAANFTSDFTSPDWATGVGVHRGFLTIYNSMKEELESELRMLIGQHPNASVVVTGHSLGAALAVLCAHHLQCDGICKPFCFPFNTPMVGNWKFAQSFRNLIACDIVGLRGEHRPFHRCLNFVNRADPVSWLRHGPKVIDDETLLKAIAKKGVFQKVALLRTKGDSRLALNTPRLERNVIHYWKKFNGLESNKIELNADKQQYFYQTPNVVKLMKHIHLGVFGGLPFHLPGATRGLI